MVRIFAGEKKRLSFSVNRPNPSRQFDLQPKSMYKQHWRYTTQSFYNYNRSFCLLDDLKKLFKFINLRLDMNYYIL